MGIELEVFLAMMPMLRGIIEVASVLVLNTERNPFALCILSHHVILASVARNILAQTKLLHAVNFSVFTVHLIFCSYGNNDLNMENKNYCNFLLSFCCMCHISKPWVAVLEYFKN